MNLTISNLMKLSKAILLFTILFLSSALFAQVPEDDAPKYVKIELTNGEEVYGYIKEQTIEKLTIETKEGEIRIIPLKLIESWERVVDRKGKHHSRSYNVQSSSYFISGNALGIKKGEGYYRNGWVLFNEASYGITDFFSIRGGLIPIIFFGESNMPYWINPKVNLPLIENKIHLGAGLLIGGITDMQSPGLSGLGYGNVTIGNRDNNFTLTGGVAFSEGSTQRLPAIGLSGMFRMSRSFYLITENYIIEGFGFFSLGGRSIWSGLSLDYGLFVPVEAEIPFPWLGIMIPFN